MIEAPGVSPEASHLKFESHLEQMIYINSGVGLFECDMSVTRGLLVPPSLCPNEKSIVANMMVENRLFKQILTNQPYGQIPVARLHVTLVESATSPRNDNYS